MLDISSYHNCSFSHEKSLVTAAQVKLNSDEIPSHAVCVWPAPGGTCLDCMLIHVLPGVQDFKSSLGWNFMCVEVVRTL